jgi:hypothetical protein
LHVDYWFVLGLCALTILFCWGRGPPSPPGTRLAVESIAPSPAKDARNTHRKFRDFDPPPPYSKNKDP